MAEECSEWTKTSQCSVSGLQVKALPRAAGRTKPWDSRLLCFVKVAKHLVNEAANCRRWEVGLLEEAAACTPGPASAMEHSWVNRLADHSFPVASGTAGSWFSAGLIGLLWPVSQGCWVLTCLEMLEQGLEPKNRHVTSILKTMCLRYLILGTPNSRWLILVFRPQDLIFSHPHQTALKKHPWVSEKHLDAVMISLLKNPWGNE